MLGRTALGRTALGRTTLGRTTSARNVPGRTTSARTAPGRTTSARTAPGRIVLGRVAIGRLGGSRATDARPEAGPADDSGEKTQPAGARPAGARTACMRPAGAHSAGRRPAPPWLAWIVRIGWLTRLGRAAPANRSVRGMLLTPWLSAGVGIVVAAGLALNMPHATLTYSPTYPGTRCRQPACGEAAQPHLPPGLTATNPGTKLKHLRQPRAHHPAGTEATTGRAHAAKPPKAPGSRGYGRRPSASGELVEVQYQTLQQWPDGFTALITIRSRADLDHWRLAFRYRGVHIDSVTGATWAARSDDDGGVASAVPWPWGAPAGHEVKILIIANGTPGQPTHCRFDGAHCTFITTAETTLVAPGSG